jgi:hypothetical protein
MLKFEDRFARQNPCEPPPGFPLASPYSSIVHHLSGPNIYAHTQIFHRGSWSVDGAPLQLRCKGSHLSLLGKPSLSLRVRVCHPNTRTHVRLLGPCFKTGWLQPFRPHHDVTDPPKRSLKRNIAPRSSTMTWMWSYNTLTEVSATSFINVCHDIKPMRTCRAPTSRIRKPILPIDTSNTGCNHFPFSDFRHYLTLFSKFFSSFPHGTCSLSVSRLYLALHGIYHAIWAAVPSNSTRRKRTVRKESLSQRRGSHPLWRSVPRKLRPRLNTGDSFYRLQFGVTK